ncbi:hypothetical protein FQN54_000118 [Arachnomyces sp. PD_36]|nr:hypothetical protein FQN54_000118 [Arachnomyces sp. PD_36]
MTAGLTARLYSDTPPDAQTRLDVNPTLLISWWATCFSLVIILVRLGGRWVRTERLFREDVVVAASIVPLFIRMFLVHFILRWGTNNVDTTGLSPEDIRHREIGSRLVLIARIFYCIFIWTSKLAITEFFKRMTKQFWRRSYHHVLYSIRCFLALTLIAVVIATLTECQPFDHYWQVVPDPGPKCRQGFAQLITMGVCDVITDILLVAFPIPIIFVSAMPMKRKISLILLFALSLILVAITCYRVPTAIDRRGAQQFRSLVASLEILAATGVANALVIGSFVRDRGVKKHKFKFSSVSDSNDHSSARRVTLTHHQWGSDADLASDLGMRLDPELHSPSQTDLARPYPVAQRQASARRGSVNPNWTFPRNSISSDGLGSSMNGSMASSSYRPDECLGANTLKPVNQNDSEALALAPTSSSQRKVSFFDIGGLLDTQPSPSVSRGSTSSHSPLNTHHDLEAQNPPTGSRAFLQDVGGLTAPWIAEERRSGASLQPPQPPQPSQQARRNSLLRDSISGNNHPASPRKGNPSVNFSRPAVSNPAPRYQREPDVSGIVIDSDNRIELQDVGGLLSPLSNSKRASDRSM